MNGNQLFDDSPEAPLSATEMSETFKATTYLLWDPALPATPTAPSCQAASVDYVTGIPAPSNCASIPIPLGMVTWQWSGDAINTRATTGTGNQASMP